MGFQQGLSGLNAAARNLDVIGNNVANANTVGAKSARAEFADLYASSLNGASSTAAGIGVTVATIAQQFTQGDISSTNNPLDVAINGQGFFEVSDNGTKAYTRNGQFKVDQNGFIVTSAGQRVQGFMADENGTLTKINSDLTLRVGGIAPKVTSEAGMVLNLDARSEVPTAAFDPADPTSYSGITSTTVYSTQGQEHVVATYFRKTADNAWEVHATVDGTAFPTNPVTTLTFDTAGKITAPTAPFTLTVPVPAAEGTSMAIQMDMSELTQFGSQFAVTDMNQNGYAAGDLTGFAIGADGTVLARYSNGSSLVQGQLTLVNFRNPQGLTPLGGNLWAQSSSSGAALTPQAAGTGDLGSLQSGALEQSNVDLTGELVNMITAQRIYQANAQTIKAQDTVLQTIVNLR